MAIGHVGQEIIMNYLPFNNVGFLFCVLDKISSLYIFNRWEQVKLGVNCNNNKWDVYFNYDTIYHHWGHVRGT